MKKWVVIVLIIILFIISVACGFLIHSYSNFSKNNNEKHAVLAEDKKEETLNTSSSDVVVSPNAEVVLVQKFEKCGHISNTKEIVPREIINLNKEKVQDYYKGWNIDKFEANEIQLSKTNLGLCNEHYILRESDGYISISCKNDIGEYIFKGLTDISVQYLPQEDLDKLNNGIEIVGRNNLNKFLEDYE